MDFQSQGLYESYIESIYLSSNLLYLCNDKGFIRRFSCKNFQETTPIMLNVRPMKIYVTPSDSYLAIIDFEKNLKILQISEDKGEHKEVFTENEVWDFHWGQSGTEYFYLKRDKIF